MTPPCSPNSRPASESTAIGLSAGGRAAAGLAVVLALAACGTRDAEPHALVTPTTSKSTSVSVAPGVDSTAEAPHTSGTGVDSDRGGDGAGRDDTGDAPEYTTDLALSVKEKEAADAAVTALEEYIAVSNEVFSSGGEGAEKFENVASDAVLLGAEETASDLRTNGTSLSGKITHTSRLVTYVDLDIADGTPLEFVVIEGCIPASSYSFMEDSGQVDDATFEYVAARYDDGWLVSEQNLVEEGCS